MNEIWNSLVTDVTAYVPNLLAALAILILGWLIALALSALVRNVLTRTSLDNRLAALFAGEGGKPVEVEKWAGRATFYLLMLLVLMAFFEALKLTVVTSPLDVLLTRFLEYVPSLMAGLVLVLIAWLVATVVRRLVTAGLKAVKLAEKLGKAAESQESANALSRTLADASYWITLLIFLPAILGALQMDTLLEPVNKMMGEFFTFLPNLVGAAVTLLVGWFVARIVQKLVTGLLSSIGTDQAAAKWGFEKAMGDRKLSQIIGMILQFVILVPVLITALDQLELAAVTQPATEMLRAILTALPVVVAAAFILIVAWLVGRVVCGLVENLLAGLGFNQVLVKIGLSKQVPEGRAAPAAVVGTLLFIGIMLAASIAAAETVGFDSLALLVHSFIAFAGEILLGLIIFGLGLVLAQLIYNVLHTSDSKRARLLAWVARVAIVILVGAMALRATGVADSIVNLAFGALVCGLALAAALAFGLGGRKVAGQQLARWRDQSEKANSD
jgi:large-conductance mechanosensitive channel